MAYLFHKFHKNPTIFFWSYSGQSKQMRMKTLPLQTVEPVKMYTIHQTLDVEDKFMIHVIHDLLVKNQRNWWIFNVVTYLRVFQKIFVCWTALWISFQPVQLQRTIIKCCNQSSQKTGNTVKWSDMLHQSWCQLVLYFNLIKMQNMHDVCVVD